MSAIMGQEGIFENTVEVGMTELKEGRGYEYYVGT
jgi:hypothetical protein